MSSRGMRRVAAGALLAVCCLAGAALAGDGPRTVSAAEFDLKAHAGQVVLLDFWASWCKPCRESLPWLSDLQRKYGDQGLRVVAINLDPDPGKAAKMLADLDPGILVVLDPEGTLPAVYRLETMPSSFLIGRDGKTVVSYVGFVPTEAAAREAEVAALLSAATQGEAP